MTDFTADPALLSVLNLIPRGEDLEVNLGSLAGFTTTVKGLGFGVNTAGLNLFSV